MQEKPHARAGNKPIEISRKDLKVEVSCHPLGIVSPDRRKQGLSGLIDGIGHITHCCVNAMLI